MKPEYTPCTSWVVTLQCECGGNMTWDHVAKLTSPALYPHSCKTCGKSVLCERIYPRTEYKQEPEEGK